MESDTRLVAHTERMKELARRAGPRNTSSIEERIVEARGLRVLLDEDLASLYGVTTKAFNQAVRRNIERFPADFSFVLTWEEARAQRSQSVTLEKGRGSHRKYPPRVFTEQGIAMLSSVLKSKRAVRVNIEVMRTFVKLRRFAVSHDALARRIEGLERRFDGKFEEVFAAIRLLITPPDKPPKRRIGFGETP